MEFLFPEANSSEFVARAQYKNRKVSGNEIAVGDVRKKYSKLPNFSAKNFCVNFSRDLDIKGDSAYNKGAGGFSSLYTCATERKFKRYVLSPDAGPL